MPGLCGIITTDGNPSSRLSALLQPLRHETHYLEDRWIRDEQGVALGRLGLGLVDQAEQPAREPGGDLIAFMDGELYDQNLLRRELTAAGCRFTSQGHAEILLHGFRVAGHTFLKRLHGSFVGAIWNTSTRQLHLISDRFGTRPLYYAEIDSGLLFASSIKSLLSHPGVSRTLSQAGLAQFFTYGHYLGEHTSLDAVHLVPPATVLTYHASSARLDKAQYWDLAAAIRDVPQDEDELLEAIDAAFHRAVARCTDGNASLGIALSGGLDARTMLGALDPQQTKLQSLCLGMPGSQDHVVSRQLAELVGCQHHEVVLDDQFLTGYRGHLERMVALTDGQYLSQGIVMPTLPIYRQLGIQVLLRGHAGELMHMRKAYNFSLDEQALEARTAIDVEDWLWRHLQSYMLDGVGRPIIRGEFQESLSASARQGLKAVVDRTSTMEPAAQQYWHLFIQQRVRRETMLSLMKFRSVVETRTPYLDADLVGLLLAAPPHVKLSDTIQTFILRRCRPDFVRVVNTNTGAPLAAGRLRESLASFRMKVLGKLGVPGYQPYERLGLWLRRELSPVVTDVLLSDECLDRGIFDPSGVREVVSSHLSQGANHTFLLLALIIFELGQRYLEQDAPASIRLCQKTRPSPRPSPPLFAARQGRGD